MVYRKLSPSLQLAFIFLVFGVMWIMLTDFLSSGLASQNFSFFSRIQTYKGVLFMCISAVFIYFVSRRILERQQIFQQQLNEQHQRYKNELAQEVFRAQESERKKLGEELHDNVNQLLGVVKLYIE